MPQALVLQFPSAEALPSDFPHACPNLIMLMKSVCVLLLKKDFL